MNRVSVYTAPAVATPSGQPATTRRPQQQPLAADAFTPSFGRHRGPEDERPEEYDPDRAHVDAMRLEYREFVTHFMGLPRQEFTDLLRSVMRRKAALGDQFLGQDELRLVMLKNHAETLGIPLPLEGKE